MRRWVLWTLVVAGCGGRAAVDDCHVVLGDPAHAVAEMAKRYPDDPVQRAAVIERCVAPDGDACERIDKIAAAIPGMLPATVAGAGAAGSAAAALAARSATDRRAVCLGMPAEMRQCMLPSYQLGHGPECQRVVAQLTTTRIEVTAPPRHAEACDDEPIAAYLTTEGVWLGTGPDTRCFAARHHGALDGHWLELQLQSLGARPCRPAVEIASAAGVRYQDVITAMDIATKVGLTDVGLSTAAELPVSFATADFRRAAPQCAAATAPHGTPEPPDRVPALPAKVRQETPVVLITRTDASITADGKAHAVGTTAELARGSGTIAQIDHALAHPPSDPTIVIQADQDTDMSVITRVLQTVKSAGYTNVLFAVKNK